MTELHKFRVKKYCFASALIAFCIAITWKSEARRAHTSEIYSTLTTDTIPGPKKPAAPNRADTSARPRITPRKPSDSTTLSRNSQQRPGDTIPPPRNARPSDTTRRLDSSVIQQVDTFNLKFSKDTLDAPIDYEAADSGVLLVREKKFLLYGGTKTTYKDVTLTAPSLLLDQQTNVVTAYNKKDSFGMVTTRAHFQQGSESFQSDTISFNFKSQKGITRNTYTKQQEMWVQAADFKKVNANTTFARRVIMTTCDYDDPHFGFVANKGKFISNRVVITGPIHPEFEGVPIPLYLPFGIFPLKQGRHSGILQPTFTVNQQFGLGLEGLGYYQVLNDYFDVTLRTNIYSYGSWSANLIPTYRKRYRYQGSLSLSLQHSKYNFKGDPDYNLIKTFNVSWNHSSNNRGTGSNFSANVNAGSTRYNENLPNNPNRNFQNQLTSSIAYTKTWQGTPFNLTLSANHNQNNYLHSVSLILPDAGFTISTIYPFARKEPIGTPKWYEKIGVGYSGVARDQISFYDTAHNTIQRLLDTLQWGAQHRFPISMSLPPIGPLIVAPFLSYEETWLTHRISQRWNSNLKKVDTVSDKKGLFIDRQMSFGINLNTALYGTYTFHNSKIIAIRHVIRPTMSINYRPNLSSKYYDYIQVDSSGRYDRRAQIIPSLFSSYGYGRFGGITFGVDNNLEMKVRNKKDTGALAIKKVKLIDGFSITSGYNFLQDSLRLLPFNMSLRTTLFDKISITAQAVLDPYDRDSLGRQINKFLWQGDRFRIGRLNAGSVSISTNFKSKPRDPAKTGTQAPVKPVSDPTLMADQERLQEYIRRNPAEFVDFNIPWSVNLSLSLFFNSERQQDGNYKTKVTSSMNFNNSFSLTPKWNFTTNGFYDFNTMKLTMFTMSVSRDMHCWQMSVNVTPIGLYPSFNITINPKSSILQDLRVNRTRTFYNY